jgi:hypothetical protein
LFADEAMLRAALVEKVRHAADVAAPLQAVVDSVADFDWLILGSRESLRRRARMIASTPYLLERELIKQHQMADEFCSVLLGRGVDPEVAGLAAHVGVHVFRTAYHQWLDDDDDADLAVAAATVMSRLATVVPPHARTSNSKAAKVQPHSRTRRQRTAT